MKGQVIDSVKKEVINIITILPTDRKISQSSKIAFSILKTALEEAGSNNLDSTLPIDFSKPINEIQQQSTPKDCLSSFTILCQIVSFKMINNVKNYEEILSYLKSTILLSKDDNLEMKLSQLASAKIQLSLQYEQQIQNLAKITVSRLKVDFIIIIDGQKQNWFPQNSIVEGELGIQWMNSILIDAQDLVFSSMEQFNLVPTVSRDPIFWYIIKNIRNIEVIQIFRCFTRLIESDLTELIELSVVLIKYMGYTENSFNKKMSPGLKTEDGKDLCEITLSSNGVIKLISDLQNLYAATLLGALLRIQSKDLYQKFIRVVEHTSKYTLISIKAILLKESNETIIENCLNTISKMIHLLGEVFNKQLQSEFILILTENPLPTKDQHRQTIKYLMIIKTILKLLQQNGSQIDYKGWVKLLKTLNDSEKFINQIRVIRQGTQEEVLKFQTLNTIQTMYEEMFKQSHQYNDNMFLIMLDAINQVTLQDLSIQASHSQKLQNFLFQQIPNTLKINIYRIDIFWELITAHLIILSNSKQLQLRESGTVHLSQLIIVGFQYMAKYYKQKSITVNEQEKQSNQGDATNQIQNDQSDNQGFQNKEDHQKQDQNDKSIDLIQQVDIKGMEQTKMREEVDENKEIQQILSSDEGKNQKLDQLTNDLIINDNDNPENSNDDTSNPTLGTQISQVDFNIPTNMKQDNCINFEEKSDEVKIYDKLQVKQVKLQQVLTIHDETQNIDIIDDDNAIKQPHKIEEIIPEAPKDQEIQKNIEIIKQNDIIVAEKNLNNLQNQENPKDIITMNETGLNQSELSESLAHEQSLANLKVYIQIQRSKRELLDQQERNEIEKDLHKLTTILDKNFEKFQNKILINGTGTIHQIEKEKWNADEWQQTIFSPWVHLLTIKYSETKHIIIDSVLSLLQTNGHQISKSGWESIIKILHESSLDQTLVYAKQGLKSVEHIINLYLSMIDQDKLSVIFEIIENFRGKSSDLNVNFEFCDILWHFGDYLSKMNVSFNDLKITLLKKIFASLSAFCIEDNKEIRNQSLHIVCNLLLYSSSTLGCKYWSEIFYEYYFPLMKDIISIQYDKIACKEEDTSQWAATCKNLIRTTNKLFRRYFQLIDEDYPNYIQNELNPIDVNQVKKITEMNDDRASFLNKMTTSLDQLQTDMQPELVEAIKVMFMSQENLALQRNRNQKDEQVSSQNI